MQTVNFNCPHCGNLMAVGMNLLGRNVRCPHCKAVVQAPTAAGEPMSSPGIVRAPVKPPEPKPPEPVSAPLPQFKLPEKDSEAPESIFGEVHEEDLFGTEPPKPTMPPPPVPVSAPPPTIEMSAREPEPLHAPQPIYTGQAPYSPTDATLSMEAPELDLEDAPPYTPPYTPPAPPPEEEPPLRTLRAPAADEGKGSNAFAIILLGYGLLMTVAAGVFGYLAFVKSSEPEHPFKAIPDVFGEYEKATRKQTSYKWLPSATADVPADLRVKLGDELVVGDLAVTPLEIRKELVTAVEEFQTGDDRVRPIPPRTLVLKLKVKNLSADVTFHPTDPAFQRRLEPKADEKAGPYTALQINREFYYGLFPWPPDGNTRKEFIQEHTANDKPLKPGEESAIFVTVAPKQDVVRNLERVPVDQSLLWRVQLRRGLVKYEGKEISATAVIGVTFKKTQIQ